MQWQTLFQKELLENWRNKKWIWFPLVMILITIMDPLTSYYAPIIIDSVGGLPEGSTLDLPDFSPSEVMMMSLSQVSQLGVLVIALISMGTIAGEQKSGVAEMILVKPVSYANYVTSKWAALNLLVWGSLLLALLASWYYINVLFGELGFGALLLTVLFYGLWLALVVSISVFYNALAKSQGLIFFLTIATIMIMSGITAVFGHILVWSPNKLSEHIQEMLITDSIPADLWGSAVITIILIAVILISSIFICRKREMAANV